MSLPRRSSVASVRLLPTVFSLPDVEAVMGCSRNAAAVYCSRWREAGLVQLFADRNGIHFNLVGNSRAPEDHLYEAAIRAFGGPLIQAGATALHAHEWTTQLPVKPELCVRVERGRSWLPEVPQAFLLPRYSRRFAKLHNASVDIGLQDLEVRLLAPEVAIADALLAQSRGLGMSGGRIGAWASLRGDLDQDMVEDNIDEISRALTMMGATDEEREHLASELLGEKPPARAGR